MTGRQTRAAKAANTRRARQAERTSAAATNDPELVRAWRVALTSPGAQERLEQLLREAPPLPGVLALEVEVSDARKGPALAEACARHAPPGWLVAVGRVVG